MGEDVFVLPSWLAGELDVAHSLACRSGNDSVKTDLRNIRKQGFTYRVTREAAGIERFYETMYLPNVRKTHGERAFVATLDELMRGCGQGAELLLVEHGGQEVAGVVLGAYDAQRLDALELGVLGADARLIKGGVLAAIYYFSLQLAAARGHTRLHLGGARPFLNDGALRYKSKWGLRITGRLPSMPDRLLLRARMTERAVASFLRNNPFVYERAPDVFRIAVFAAEAEQAPPALTERWWRRHPLGGIEGVTRFRLADGEDEALPRLQARHAPGREPAGIVQ